MHIESRSARQARRSPWRSPLLLGVATSLLQLWLCLLASGYDSLSGAYASFGVWDGEWYEHIARVGYVSSLPPVKWNRDVANVAFFPGFPIWARIVGQLTFLSPRFAVILAAQIMAMLFWMLYYLTISRWSSSRFVWFLGAFFILAHPGAFFLQVGYSESLFLASLLGFLLLSHESKSESPSRRWSAALGAGIGVIMTATRIVGAPLAFLGLMSPALDLLSPQAEGQRRDRALRALVRQSWVSVLSLAGVAAFFAFCWLRWGRWDLYMWTQQIGWDIRPDYFAVLQLNTWTNWSLANWWPNQVEPDQMSKVFTSLYLALLALTGAIELFAWRKGVENFHQRLPYYVSGLLMMYISVSGLASVGYKSMLRYTFPVHVCWLLGLIGLFVSMDHRFRLMRYTCLALALLFSVYTFLLQLRFLNLFTHIHWVA